MKNKGTVSAVKSHDIWIIKVSGNASFECAPKLREIQATMKTDPFNGVYFDLDGCEWMDSTFMGMVAMLSLEDIKKGRKPEVYHASESVHKLLDNLGLKKLLDYKDGSIAIDLSMPGEDTAPAANTDQVENAHIVLDAHKTLMQVDDANVARFTPVVELVQQDLDRLEADRKD